jgi:hypothetical protein
MKIENMISIPTRFQKAAIPMISKTFKPGMLIYSMIGESESLDNFYIIPTDLLVRLKEINMKL